tara:strand:- start:1370 stop:1621 length:252 start_codon:yes stop_codon:yes gene_type:complete
MAFTNENEYLAFRSTYSFPLGMVFLMAISSGYFGMPKYQKQDKYTFSTKTLHYFRHSLPVFPHPPIGVDFFDYIFTRYTQPTS